MVGSCVADPDPEIWLDPDPIQNRKNVSDPNSNLDPKLEPKKSVKRSLIVRPK
jgi:hypothetical protein